MIRASNTLAGKILIANPYRSFGDIFDKSVIYVVAHTSQGALGLIVNKHINNFSLKKLYKINDKDLIDQNKDIFIGGPIEPERSFILHSSDYSKNYLFNPDDNLLVTSNTEIVKAILSGNGPQNHLVILGYTGWGAGQFENEIAENYWLIDDLHHDIIFSTDISDKWIMSLTRLGVNLSLFGSQNGHS